MHDWSERNLTQRPSEEWTLLLPDLSVLLPDVQPEL